MKNLDDVSARNQQTFTSNDKTFRCAVDSGFGGNFSEAEVHTKPVGVLSEANDIEGKNKIQNDDCCGDCNSINCPHCDCSYW